MTQVDFDEMMRDFCTNDETLEKLKSAAFEVLRLNPGCEQSDWANILVEQYGTEVVDAYGKDPAEAYAKHTASQAASPNIKGCARNLRPHFLRNPHFYNQHN